MNGIAIKRNDEVILIPNELKDYVGVVSPVIPIPEALTYPNIKILNYQRVKPMQLVVSKEDDAVTIVDIKNVADKLLAQYYLGDTYIKPIKDGFMLKSNDIIYTIYKNTVLTKSDFNKLVKLLRFAGSQLSQALKWQTLFIEDIPEQPITGYPEVKFIQFGDYVKITEVNADYCVDYIDESFVIRKGAIGYGIVFFEIIEELQAQYAWVTI